MKQPIAAFTALLLLIICSFAFAQGDASLDSRVQAFLDTNAREWRDLNVPMTDGRILHNIIVENGYTQAYEIGTSTGHSTIWIAWALAKTGGRLTTIEIDRRRYEEAMRNVAEAGLSDYVEFILGNAHELVPEAEGPYDFVFSDADKDWYINYFDAMYPKLTDDACFVAHNVEESTFRLFGGWEAEYLEHVRETPDMETTVHPDGRNGVAMTCKIR